MATLRRSQPKLLGIMPLGAVALLTCCLTQLPLRAAEGTGLNLVPCPKLQPPLGSGQLQPMRIKPADVAAKNALGCLSPADAVYGPDGCPVRFCSPKSGVIPLPGGALTAP